MDGRQAIHPRSLSRTTLADGTALRVCSADDKQQRRESTRMSRFIFLPLTIVLVGCNTFPPAADPLPQTLDGKWRIDLLNAPSFACVEVAGEMLQSFDLGCTGDNLLSSPGGLFYDDQGPAFSVVSAQEGQITFWLTRIKGGYAVIVERSSALSFGVMTADES
jgi:hypothetical protein